MDSGNYLPNNLVHDFTVLDLSFILIFLLFFTLVDETASASVSSTSTNILSPSLASEMESLSLTSDVKTTVIAPVSCNSLC